MSVPEQYKNFADQYELGFARGKSCSSWCDIPEIGANIPRHLDWVGYRVVTAENQLDVHSMLAYESESNSRDYSPFEFVAHELNEMEDSESAWEAFDAGINAGIESDLKSRYSVTI